MNLQTILKPAAWVALSAAALAGCAGIETNNSLEAARVEVNAAASDPDVMARAPLELREAQGALDAGINAQRDRGDRAVVDHYAYLAQVRAKTARELASSRRATDELARANSDVDRMRLAARTQEADQAREKAFEQSRAAQAARADADAASRQAAIASQDARAANRQALAANQQSQEDRARAEAAMLQSQEDRARAETATAEVEQARMRTRELITELQARETERGLLVTLGDVLFATGESVLLPNAAARMDTLASFLNRFPEKTLLIEGYTDSVGGDAFNQDLSVRRAEAVRVSLEARGVNASRMATRGYGEAYPVASNASQEGRQLNRRVEVVVSDERGNLRPRLGALR